MFCSSIPFKVALLPHPQISPSNAQTDILTLSFNKYHLHQFPTLLPQMLLFMYCQNKKRKNTVSCKKVYKYVLNFLRASKFSNGLPTPVSFCMIPSMSVKRLAHKHWCSLLGQPTDTDVAYWGSLQTLMQLTRAAYRHWCSLLGQPTYTDAAYWGSP